MCEILQDLRQKHGDLEVYCGDVRIAGLSVLPTGMLHPTHDIWPNKTTKVISIIPRR
jgi:hypothetical protein